MKLFSYLNNQLDYYMTGKKVTGQLSSSQWHQKYSHFHLHPKQALFLDFSIVSMGARDLVSNPFHVYQRASEASELSPCSCQWTLCKIIQKLFKITNFKGAGGPMFKTCQCAPYIAVMTISEFKPNSRLHS